MGKQLIALRLHVLRRQAMLLKTWTEEIGPKEFNLGCFSRVLFNQNFVN